MAIKKLKIPNIIVLVFVVLAVVLLFFSDKLVAWLRPAPQKAAKDAASVREAAMKQEKEPPPDVPPALARRYKAIVSAVEIARVKKDISALSSYPSRMVGYPGCADAADYVEARFKAAGLKNVRSEDFKVTVPIDEGSRIVINGQQFPIHALWPNLVRTSQLPPEGLDVHLIDAESGRLPDFDDRVVQGSAALVDFNSGTEWLNAPRLGAKVLLFVEPEDTMRGEGEAKFSAIPVSMPRFWISKENAAKIRTMLADVNSRYADISPLDRPKLRAKVYCKMPWEKVSGRNIVGVIPGSGELKNEWIVLHASYDGTSVVPALAPGAESTCGIAGLIELARLYSRPEFAPKRSVMFIATSGHFQGLAGMRAFMEEHIDSYVFPSTLDRIHAGLNARWPASGGGAPPWIVPALAFIVLALIVNSIRVRMSGARQRHRWLAAVPIALILLSALFTAKLYTAFAHGFDYSVPDPPEFYLWAGLDLSSQTEGVGLFYKGYFYDYREDLQGKFSDLASRSRGNSERVAYTLGFYKQKDARFADGVNPIQGKNWRNFIPGKIALDSEVVTLAGGKGVSFVSIDDGRVLVDTPFDTPDRINFANLNKQLVMIACLTDHWFRDTNTSMDELTEPAKVVNRTTIEVDDPLEIGFMQGVYTDPDRRSDSYYKARTEKDMPASLVDGRIKLSRPLPAKVKTVYVRHKPLTKLGVAADDPCKFARMGLQGGFARLSGNVVQYDPRKSFVPNMKVGDCLAVVRSNHKSFMGVRANIVDKTTRLDGKFVIPGVAPVTAGGRGTMTSIGAYKLDPVRGDIICAPDQGSYGEVYPTEFPITTGYKDMPIIVFNCKATSVYDLVDPQSLRALTGMSVYDGDTNATPRQFGVAVAIPEPHNPHIEDMAVIFTEDTAKTGSLAVGSSEELRRIRLKLVMSAGPAANRLLLLNSTIGAETVPAEVVETNRRALPVDKDWRVSIEGAYTTRSGSGENYYLRDLSGSDTSLASGMANLTEELAKDKPRGVKTVYVKTSQNEMVPAEVVKVVSVDKPWYGSVSGIFTDRKCSGRNYYLPPSTESVGQSLRSDEVCASADLPIRTVYARTENGRVIPVPAGRIAQKAILTDNPLQVVVKGIYGNEACAGENYYKRQSGEGVDLLTSGSGPLLASNAPADLEEVWIKTSRPQPIRAKVAGFVTVDKPMDFFVAGVYNEYDENAQKVTGPNYCKFKNDVYNGPSLLKGEIQLTSKLPEGADQIYIKPVARPEGIGYDVTEGGTLEETAYKVARDMWNLDEYRLSKLESKGVKNEGLSSLHAQGRRNLDLAEQAKGSLNYSVFDSFCRASWGYEARAYPDVTSTAQDVVNGVIFYLFLMMPFAFFCERLFFAWPNLGKQILTFFVIFIIIFITFWFVHPAFQIAGNALVVLIAFVMLALSILVIFIITSKFEEQLKQFNRQVSGIHKADIGRMSVAAAAFSLGISNMRRRKARTVLTCVTLILLTFTVLSFTSIVSVLRFNKVPAKKDADTHIYQGIMIRTAMWESMQELAYRLLKDEFGNEGKRGKVYPVAPRAWFFGTQLGEQSFLTLRRGDKSYDAKAAVGMVPDEAQIMDLDGPNARNKRAFLAGDWFGYKNGKRLAEEVDPYSMIIPDSVAEKLEIEPGDVGKAQVEFAGAKYTVVGIIKNDIFKKIKDLDNEPLTPVDYILMSKQSQQQQQSMGEAGFREYTHHEPNNVFIVPFDTLMSMGGEVKSIAIKFATFEEVQGQLEALMPRLGLNLYAGVGDSIYRYSSIAASSSKGFSNVFIPVLIAALIVLNTMLGSVYERVREIGIFSSIGLAPNHIAVLFIAESMVYANLGAVAGYVIGQAVSKLLMSTNWLPGLYLNFSSMSAVTSTIVVVAVVLLSTLYPARKASEVATPAVDRSWKVPDPVGDNWDIVLPFAVTGEQAVGVNGFLKEWFQAYEEYSIGDFVTQDVESSEIDTEHGKGYCISCKAWLAPFDLGVSQVVTLQTLPTAMEDVFEVKLRITRESGDISNWKRVNRRFLNTLRKQFLIWRTLRVEERDKYLQPATPAESADTEAAPA